MSFECLDVAVPESKMIPWIFLHESMKTLLIYFDDFSKKFEFEPSFVWFQSNILYSVQDSQKYIIPWAGIFLRPHLLY